MDAASRADNKLIQCQEQRIAVLETALHAINRLNDHPARFNKELQDVLDAVIDTSDVKFDRG